MEQHDTRLYTVERKTAETDIHLTLALDGDGKAEIDTGVPFLDHMLTLFTVHGFFDLVIAAKGDIEVDDHHTVEDVGICLGQAFAGALDTKAGINRYGSCLLPMDEALVRIAVDLSNRPFLHFVVPVVDQKIGTFDSALGKEFLRALTLHAGMTLHVDLLHGENGHHIFEAIFKGLGRAMSEACSLSERGSGVLSSKGCL